jgi:signal transduction histidine kinase
MVLGSRSSALHGYVAAVSTAGLGLVAALLAVTDGPGFVRHAPAAFWLLACCLVLSDLFLLPVPRPATSQSVTLADAFAFAVLLGWGVTAAVLTLTVASVASDLARRRGLEKLLFNAGQYALIMAASGGVYELAGGGRPFSARYLPALAAAGLVYFLANEVLVGVVTTLIHGSPFLTGVMEALRTDALPSAMLLGLAPILLLIADESVALLPLLLIPLVAVYLAFKSALRAEQDRAAAERAAVAAEALAAEQARLVEVEHRLVETLQESDRLKDDLLATVSHELRTPLAGLLGVLATLSGRGDALSTTQRNQLVAMAERQGGRLKELIEQLLLAARFEHARGEHRDRPAVDVATLAGQAAAAAKMAHPERTVVLDANAALPVRAVPEALLQVLGNLLDNAAKYSPDGTPIRLEAGRAGALAVLAVEDAGPGVPRPERDRIFERFTQLDSGATRRAGGVGLGLYIARQLAQAQGGELLVGEPLRAGAGVRFELRLPLAEEASPGTGPGQDGQAYDRPA